MRWFRPGSPWRLGTILSLLSLVATLAACGGTTSGGAGGGVKGPKNALVACPQSTNGSAAASESGKITLNVSGWSSSPAEDALVTQGFQNFSTKYPNITVKWSPIP